jgi:hypothetical protein
MKKAFEDYLETGETSKRELKELLELKEKGLLGRIRDVW